MKADKINEELHLAGLKRQAERAKADEAKAKAAKHEAEQVREGREAKAKRER